MATSLYHRGPDSSGVECLGQCLLVNTRLAIIDLSERGRQPMCTEDRSLWITYNGEIYNATELRELLLQRGHRFRSSSDTEVLLHLYQEFGEAAVRRLRGMFAFAIWDTRARKLVLGRDRLGIKPLYYSNSEGQIVFASELKTLLASGLVCRKLDANGLGAFLQFGHVPPPWTALERAKPLEPGHIAIWEDGKLRKEQYWSVDPHAYPKSTRPPGELAAQLRDVLLDSTRMHLISDVPVVVFLSGGIDSAILAALALRAGARDLTAVTLGFQEGPYDESSLSQRTALALELPHRIHRLPAQRVAENIDRALWAMDQPTVDGINSYMVSRVGAEAGFKVALTGQGADELFGGYESLAMFLRLFRLAQLRGWLPRRALVGAIDRRSLPFRWRKLLYLLEVPNPFLASQLAVKVLYRERNASELLSPALVASNHNFSATEYLAQESEVVAGLDFKEKVGYLDITTHLQPRLLRDMDAMSMAHSLEVRPVYLDHPLVEFMLAVPAELRIHHKRLLLEATRPVLGEKLYRDLLARQKRTFTFPFAHWMARELRPMIEQTLAPERVNAAGVLNPANVEQVWQQYCRAPGAVGWPRAWSMFVLQRWCEIMKVSP